MTMWFFFLFWLHRAHHFHVTPFCIKIVSRASSTHLVNDEMQDLKAKCPFIVCTILTDT